MERIGKTLLLMSVLAVVLAVGGGCSSDDKADDTDGKGGTGGDGDGDGDSSAVFECGGTACDAVDEALASQGVTQCCTGADQCGLNTPLAETCLEPDAPGGLDPACEDFSIPGFLTFPGCCTPEGTCGGLGEGFGCIPLEDLGETGGDCTYDPDNDCTELYDVPCDGAEDCSGSQVCCGQFLGGAYQAFLCMDACEEGADPDVPGMLFEMCHRGDSCSVEGYTCQQSGYLPDELARCYDSGRGDPITEPEPGVNCGDAMCAGGEKCCLRTPRDPVCIPADDDCTCTYGAGDEDAGM